MENIIEKEWTTASGFKAEVMFNIFNGFRCGYVYIPESHPLHNVGFWNMNDIEVHGGVNYSHSSKYDKTWKIGFDCGHCYDKPDVESWEDHLSKCNYNDEYERNKAMHRIEQSCLLNDGEVRSKDYVVEQCEILAHQLV